MFSTQLSCQTELQQPGNGIYEYCMHAHAWDSTYIYVSVHGVVRRERDRAGKNKIETELEWVSSCYLVWLQMERRPVGEACH